MRQKIYIKSWKRREVFAFFRDFVDPCFSITTELKCKGGYQRAKERGESFFIHYLYAILKAHNSIEEFHYRVESAEDGVVIYRYDKIDITTVVSVGDDGEYRSIFIPYSEDFDTFYKVAKERIEGAKKISEPFPKDNSNGLGLVCASAIPSIRFTSIRASLPTIGAVDMLPLMSIGRMEERDGVMTMPMMIQMHHGLIDGYHVGKLFELIEAELR